MDVPTPQRPLPHARELVPWSGGREGGGGSGGAHKGGAETEGGGTGDARGDENGERIQGHHGPEKPGPEGAAGGGQRSAVTQRPMLPAWAGVQLCAVLVHERG